MKRLALISDFENQSPVFRALFPEIFSDFDKVICLSDLYQTSKSLFAVSRILEPHHRAVTVAEGFDYILSTSLFGLPYFLLQSFSGKIEVFAFDMLGLRTPTGKIFNEIEIAHLELEEVLLRDHPDKFISRSNNIQTYISHFYGNAPPSPALGQGGALPEKWAQSPLVFLPQGRLKPMNGITLEAQEYVQWAQKGDIPANLQHVDLCTHILVDEGNDHLQLGHVLTEQKSIGAVLLALDQKRPSQTVFPEQIPCYGNVDWIAHLLNRQSSQFPGFGPIDTYCSRTPNPPIRTPRLSVILVHHNRPKFLNLCLAGFAHQNFTNFEIILIDNGSDELPNLRSFPNLDITLVKNKNTFPGYARNLGAEISKAEYVLFFDDDNIPMPDLVHKMLAACVKSTADYITCFRRTFLHHIGDNDEIIINAPRLKHSAILKNFLGDVVFLMRRDKFLTLRFTDYYAVGREDFEFIHAANAIGFEGQVLPQPLYHYRLGNRDKIGQRHLTHRTGFQLDYDYGAFRKHRRATASYTQAKIQQLMENYHVNQLKNRQYTIFFRKLYAILKRLAYRQPWIRLLYFRQKNTKRGSSRPISSD